MENNTFVKDTPKDFFLSLFNILAFYISVIGFIVLYVQYINVLFPDSLNFYYTRIADAVRWSTSILFIAVPVYILTSWLLAKDLNISPGKRELKFRKLLIYLTLFVSVVTIAIDLIMFVYNFLGGGLTIQFFLKIFVVLLVATAVFGYYIWDLKRKDLKSKVPKILAWTLSFVVLASIILGFFIVGTPTDQRNRKNDEKRIENLQIIQDQIINYWMQKESIPENLSKLEDSISGFIVPKDPKSELMYEYNVGDSFSFELCAIFETSSEDFGIASEKVRPVSIYDSFQQNWSHEAERTCFKRTIDPELYKNKIFNY